MRTGFPGSLLTLLLAAPFCFAQPAYVEIRVPVGVRSETMYARYVLDDDFGAWLQPRPGVSSYFIAIRPGARAARFRALIYAPGCAIQTVDLPVPGSAVPQYSFVCEPLQNIRLAGTLTQLKGHEINLQVKYVAPWAQRVLGLGDGILTDIPVGGSQPALTGGSFQLSLPDLAEDPLAGAPDHAGELRILARDRASGKLLAQLVPKVEFLKTRMGGLQIRKEYPDPVEFAFCAADGRPPHDVNGFAIRPPGADDAACNH